jgi:uncharacterized protein YbcI
MGGMDSNGGRQALDITNAIVRLHRDFYGRGAGSARTVINRNFVISFLEDIYTPVEKTLLEAGEEETVRNTRHIFQRTMEDRFVEAVEEITGRKVIAFLSQVHFDPDLAVETFVLEPQDGDHPLEAEQA